MTAGTGTTCCWPRCWPTCRRTPSTWRSRASAPTRSTACSEALEAEEKRYAPEHFDLEAALAEAEAKPITQPGDFWLLGDHRLLCGDSTSEADVARLMNGKQASLLATDPPYLVDYDAGNHPPSKSNKGKPNRNKNWDEYNDPESSA